MKPVWIEAFRDRPALELLDYGILALLIFVLPFFVVIGAHDGFVTAKWCALGVLGLLMVGALVTRVMFGARWIVPLHGINGLLALYFIWQLMSFFWSGSKRLWLEDALQSGLVLGICVAAQSVVYGDRRRILGLGVLIVFAATLAALWVVVVDFVRAANPDQGMVLSRLNDWRDALSLAGFGNTGHSSDFIVVGFLFSLMGLLWVQGLKRIVFFQVILGIQAAGLIVNWSLHSNISLIAGSVLLATLIVKRWWWKPKLLARLRRLFPLVGIWLFVLLFYVVNHPLNPHRADLWKPTATAESALPGILGHAFSSARWQDGGVTRLAIWYTTIGMIESNPILGVGAGNFTYVYPTVAAESVLNNPSLERYAHSWTNAAHQIFLQVAAELGLVGLVLLLAAILWSLFLSWHRSGEESWTNHLILCTALCAFVAMLLQGQMNFILELPVSSLLFFLLLVVPLVLPKRGVVVDAIFPVSRDYGILELGIYLKNMQSPVALFLSTSLSKLLAICVVVFAWIIVFVGCFWSVSPLRASIQYKTVYEEMRIYRSTGSIVDWGDLVQKAESVVKLNPGHRDARATLVELYLLSGKESDLERAEFHVNELGKTLQDSKYLQLRLQTLLQTGQIEKAQQTSLELERRFSRPSLGEIE
ncbi:MAG: O-antigen ligase family protein [Candidatus Sumerlaeia bacterium]|nr:O-antigen ligase family protein [Candidatus Sumerlaeia bacterium]